MSDRILVVDGDTAAVELVSHHLRRSGFEVLGVKSGEEGLTLARAEVFQLLILDLVLPDMDGLVICRELRKEQDLPILVLTARNDEIDRVLAFELGIDDYVSKPFSPRELVSRVKAILRRSGVHTPRIQENLTFGTLCINLANYEVALSGRRVELTPREFKLLKVLAQNPGRVFTRQELMDRVLEEVYTGNLQVVDVHMRHLREKLEENPSKPHLFETVRSVGYRFAGLK